MAVAEVWLEMRIASLDDLETSRTDGWPWLRLRIDGALVSNAIDGLDWRNPVQLELCEHCGTPGCSSNGYVHVSRDGDRVYWTRSQGDPDYQVPSMAVASFGGLAFDRGVWRRLGERFGVPPAEAFPQADARVFRDALLDTVGADTSADLVDRLREDLLASTTLSVEQAGAAVRTLVLDLEEDASRSGVSALGWRLVGLSSHAYEAECLYLDGRNVVEWPILALYQGEVVLRLGDGLLLVRLVPPLHTPPRRRAGAG